MLLKCGVVQMSAEAEVVYILPIRASKIEQIEVSSWAVQAEEWVVIFCFLQPNVISS